MGICGAVFNFDERGRAQVHQLTQKVQEVTGEHVEVAFVDQGYTSEAPAEEAVANGIKLEVVSHKGFRRQVVSLWWTADCVGSS